MPTPANGNHPDIPVDSLTNVKVKKVGSDPTSSSARLETSHLGLAEGSYRTYMKGLDDPTPSGLDDTGPTITITCSFLTDTAPTAGGDYTIEGVQMRCTECEFEYAVGDLVKGTATFVSIPESAGS